MRGRGPGATLEGDPEPVVPRRAGTAARRGDPHSHGGGPPPLGWDVYESAPAAFAASRTAPATAPATLSLKTLGMM
ncbi:hypothetical protein GCM10010377_08990 [Streptomyces viridiviolaceus]|nr:hypothetical protein GCM10010377_08990 [Streptomyces viridiviolaceus]